MAGTAEPTDHWAYFGDGNAAQIIDSREYVNRKSGIRYIKFILLPSKRIEQMYDITTSQDDTGAISVEYKKNELQFLERGIHRTRVWIFVDFMGNETPASRRYADLTETLNDTDRLLRSSEAAKNRLFQELQMEREQKRMTLRQQADLLKEIGKARGRTDGDPEDINADQE